jgi:hypothetical protein
MKCAMCGSSLNCWYYGMRAPLCPSCCDSAGPVRRPAEWDAGASFSDAGRDVRQSYAEAGR